MKPYTKLNTPLSQEIFDFIKLYLIDFVPDKIHKPSTANKPASKYSFNYLLKHMAGQSPLFLTKLIY